MKKEAGRAIMTPDEGEPMRLKEYETPPIEGLTNKKFLSNKLGKKPAPKSYFVSLPSFVFFVKIKRFQKL